MEADVTTDLPLIYLLALTLFGAITLWYTITMYPWQQQHKSQIC